MIIELFIVEEELRRNMVKV